MIFLYCSQCAAFFTSFFGPESDIVCSPYLWQTHILAWSCALDNVPCYMSMVKHVAYVSVVLLIQFQHTHTYYQC